MFNSFHHHIINSLIQCRQCAITKNIIFAFLVNTKESVHGRPLQTHGHVSRTHYFGHEQNIISRTSSRAGFTFFHLMQIESFSSNSQPFRLVFLLSALQPNTFSRHKIDRVLFWSQIVTCQNKVGWTQLLALPVLGRAASI